MSEISNIIKKIMGEEKSKLNEIDFSGKCLALLLEPDTLEILQIDSLEDYEDEKYNCYPYIRNIESTIAIYYYFTDRKIKDIELIALLEDIKCNYEKEIDSFETVLQQLILRDIYRYAVSQPIMHHEFKLVIDYITMSIDNRSWLRDKQAYLKWITYKEDLLSEEEEAKYFKKIERFFKKYDLDMDLIDKLWMR